jgi:hypothetical protein
MCLSLQLKELPGVSISRRRIRSKGARRRYILRIAAWTTPSAPPPAARAMTRRAFRVAQSLLEREIGRTDLAPAEAGAARSAGPLRERNVTRVSGIYRGAFELKTQMKACGRHTSIWTSTSSGCAARSGEGYRLPIVTTGSRDKGRAESPVSR